MDQELAALRKTALAIVGAKRKGEDQQIGHLATEGLLQILKIKEANKRLCARVEAAKEETSSCKLSLENSDSTLQNLLYEKSYYEKEIHTCRSFVSKVKDEAVALMSAEQFFASLGSTAEDDALRAKANSSAHELMKARLVHENALRKSLVEQLAGLKQEKQATQDAVNVQAKLLNELQTRLKGVESTAKPLQTVLGPTVHLKGSVSRASEVLPTPLYIVYSQLIAAGEALQMGCSVSILGSTEEAESFARSLVTDSSAVDDSHPNSPNYQPASLEDLYKPHPLSVELHVHREASPSPTVIKPPTILMSVILQYLPALKVVTAHCKDPADNVVLKSLFPADDGSGMPIEALQQLQAGTFKFSSSRVPRPYRWCQLLAGLDFVPTLPQLAVQLQPGEQLDTVLTGLDTYRKQQRVPAVVARLRQVKIGEAALNSLITFKAMMHNYIPADITMYSGVRPTSVVLSWEQIATVTAATLPDTPAPRPSRAPTYIGAGRQPVQPALAQAFAAAEEEGALDDGELPQGLEQQQPLSNGAAGAAAAGDADGDQEPASEGGGAMAWEGRDQQRDEEEEEGALPDEAQDDTMMHDQQAPDTSTRERSGRSRMKSDAALKLLLLEVNEEEAIAEPVARQARPVSRRYRLVARSNALELEASVWVFSEYPIRAPLFRVRALRQLPAASADAIAAAREKGLNKDPVKSLPAVLTSVPVGEALGPVASANHVAWLEQQVNVAALGLVPKARSNDTLCYQVFHLRLALDAVTRAYELGSAAGYSNQAVPGAAKNLPVTVPGVQRQVEDLAVLHFRQQLVGRDRQPPPRL